MNREIKYKAWDKAKKVWKIVTGLHFFGGEKLTTISYDSEEGEIMDVPVEEFEIVEYTGLKDKDGKDIYTGDVLKMDSWTPEHIQVKFIEGAFCLANAGGHYIGEIHYTNHANIPQSTVVGNVFENPNLLKNEQ